MELNLYFLNSLDVSFSLSLLRMDYALRMAMYSANNQVTFDTL